MTTYIITRHPATITYLKEEFGYSTAIAVTHVDEEFFSHLEKGDQVIGVLPAPLMARVCKITKHPFTHFEINLPPELRGKELSVKDLKTLLPQLTKFMVKHL